jgi:hypothetical protein
VVHEAHSGRWFLLAWLLAVTLLMPGAGSTYATVPAAVACAIALVDVLRPLVPARPRRAAVLLGVAWAAALFGALTVRWNPNFPVDEIPRSDRELMAEIRESGITEYAVLTGRPWYDEGPAEWGAAITGASDIALLQGSEWLGEAEWNRRKEANEDLQICGRTSAECLVRWMDTYGIDFVLVSAVVREESQFREDLATNERLRTVVQDGDSVLVELVPAPAT